MGEMRTLVKVLSTPEDSDVDRFKLQFIMILQLDLSSSVLAFWTYDSYVRLATIVVIGRQLFEFELHVISQANDAAITASHSISHHRVAAITQLFKLSVDL